MIRRLSFAAAMLTAALFAGSAGAAPDSSVIVKHVNVAYGDLNLATPDGRLTLQTRIAEAASRACGSNPAFTSHPEARAFVESQYRICRSAAQHQALAELNARGVRLAVNAR